MRRLALVVLMAVATVSAVAPAAAWATLRVEVKEQSFGAFGSIRILQITDTTGGPNALTVSQVGAGSGLKLQVATTGTVEAGPGCAPSAFRSEASISNVLGPTIVCSRPAGDFTQVTATLDPQAGSASDDVMRVGAAGGTSAFDYQVNMTGGGGDDTLEGGPEQDILLGGSGNDTLKGNGGKDHLEGDLGADTLLGGDGDDQLLEGACCTTFGDPADTYDGGPGVDRLTYSGGGAARVLLLGALEGPVGAHDANRDGAVDPIPDSLQSIEELLATNLDDGLSIASDSRDGLVLFGLAGPDVVAGGPGNDRLVGGPVMTPSAERGATMRSRADRELTTCSATREPTCSTGRRPRQSE